MKFEVICDQPLMTDDPRQKTVQSALLKTKTEQKFMNKIYLNCYCLELSFLNKCKMLQNINLMRFKLGFNK